MANTPVSYTHLTPYNSSFFSLSSSFFTFTAYTETPIITSKLKAADPTMVEAPNYPGQDSIVVTVSITASKISGILDPIAIKVKFATVGFQTLVLTILSSPSLIT